jgi:pyrimidine oxygenase
MKFGVFLPNGSNGYLMTTAIKPYLPTWELNKAITLEAEKQGLDFVLSMMKHKGFGGATGHWDACLESFTLTSALAAITERIGLVSTVTILAQHPAYTARMMATLDDISDGRTALNIVTGWNKHEYEQMGLWRGGEYYEQRYEYALDYVNILRGLWQGGGFTHKSKFFDLEDCHCLPLPRHEIPIVSAGQSKAGSDFVAAVGGHNFIMSEPKNVRRIAADLNAAGQKTGNKVGTYALFHLVTAENDNDARAECDNIVAGGDVEAIKYMIGSATLDTVKDGTTEQVRQAAEADAGLLGGDLTSGNMAFMGFPVIYGSYESVAAQIDEMAADPNLDGLLFSWPDWVPGIRTFGEKVMPLLKCRQNWDVMAQGGLRGTG